MSQQTKETFAEQIARLKNEERNAEIQQALAKQKAEDDAATASYRKSFFTNDKLALGTVVRIDGDTATIQLEVSTTSVYPRDMDKETGKIVVRQCCRLAIVATKKERLTATPQVGDKGAVESISFNGVLKPVFIIND